jgi:cytochrome c oxidase subunit 1
MSTPRQPIGAPAPDSQTTTGPGGSTLREGVLDRITHHRFVGFGYLAIAMAAVVIGTLLSLAIRLHRTWPTLPMPFHGPILPEEYLALVTMHGTLMLFFVLTVAPQSGFGNIVLPAQIGAECMSFPRINLASMLLTAVALVVLVSAFFVPAGAPIGGWTAYPPLSATSLAGPGQGTGMDLWLASIALFAIASTMSSVNTLTTIVQRRCDGMTWERLPLTVWGWFTAAMLSVLAFSVLLAALLLLFCDRHLHSGFFLPSQELVNGVLLQHRGDGSPLLWLHLFWFFGHPEVYIAILPGMGLTSMVLANFARRPVFAYRLMIATTLLIGLLGIFLWGHHMFVAGLNPFAGTAFSISTIAISIPASAKVLSWLATVWRSRSAGAHSPPQLTAAMLFALGFVSLFITGGLSGPILAQPILDEYLHNTFFVVAHFHLIMAMAGVFGLFCGTYYWAPLLFHRRLSEALGKWHFWLTTVFAYATFLPMHLTGLAGEPRHYAQLDGLPGPATTLLTANLPIERFITVAAICLASSQLLFFINLLLTLRRPRASAEAMTNPWSATTLEWAPPPAPDAPPITVYRLPCEYSADGEEFLAQWQPSRSTAQDRE